MKINIDPAAGIFMAGILFSCLFSWTACLDIHLYPRFFSLAVFLAVTLFLLSPKKFSIGKPDRIILAYPVFVILAWSSLCWSVCDSETYVSAARHTAGLFVFFLSLQFFRQESENTFWLFLLALIISFISSAYCLWLFATGDFHSHDDLYKLTGLNSHKNLVSSFHFLLLFFLVSASLNSHKPFRLIVLFAIALNALVIILLQTMAVWLGLLAAAVLFLIFYRSKACTSKKSLLVFAGALVSSVLILVLVLPAFLQFFFDVNKNASFIQGNNIERLQIWQKTYESFKHHFISGFGSGQWQVFFPSAGLQGMWRAEDLNVTFQRPHNDFLWILSENGIFGFILFYSVPLFAIVRSLSSGETANKIAGAFLSGYLVISFFDFPSERAEHVLFSNILLAFCFGKSNFTATGRIKIPFISFVPVAIFIGVIFYYRVKGEIFTREMYSVYVSQNASGIIQKAEEAETMFYMLDPYSVPLKWYTGNAEVMKADYNKAIADFRKALSLSPYNRHVLNDLGSVLVKEGQQQLAKIYYQKAIKISPRFDDAKLNLAAVLLNENKPDSAMLVLKSLLHDSERRTNYEKLSKLMVNRNASF